MSSVPKVFLGLFILLLAVVIMTGILSANIQATNANHSYEAYVAEIENSNLSESVTASCAQSAKEDGFELAYNPVKNSQGKVIMVEITFSYPYTIPFLGIEKERTIRGYAR